MRTRTNAVAVAALAICSSGGLPAQKGGLDILDGETLWADGGQVFLSEVYRSSSRFFRGSEQAPDPLNRVLRESRTTLGLNYGLLGELTVSALVPWIHNELTVDGPSGRDTDVADGLGDTTLLAKYRLWKTDWYLGSCNWALFVGGEIPTGETDETADGVRLAPALQPGSGSWDAIAATALTFEQDRFKLNGALVYEHPGEGAQDYTFGDLFVAELTPGYRLIVDKFPGPLLRLDLGLQWRHESPADAAGARVADSGGDLLLFRPGLVFWPRPWWGIVLAAELPLWRDVGGSQVGLDDGIFLSVSYRF
ncbi:MAG: transporter [Planctomycetota bacterium]